MLNNKIAPSLLSSLGRVHSSCPSSFLSFLPTTYLQLSSIIDFLPDVPCSYLIFPPGNTDGRIASSVAKCGGDQAWQCHCQSFAPSSPLISSIDFNTTFFFFFFVKHFLPLGLFLALEEPLFHHMCGWYLEKQGVLCYSSDRNNSEGQVTWNIK